MNRNVECDISPQFRTRSAPNRSTHTHTRTHRPTMDLRQLLNRQEDRATAKRVPLGELSTNRAPLKRSKPNPVRASDTLRTLQQSGHLSSLPLAQAMSTPQRPSSGTVPLSLPPISHLTHTIGAPQFVTNATLPTTPTTPSTPTRASSSTPLNCNSLYGVRNSRKRSEVFFSITSADDFQRFGKNPDTDPDRSMDRSMDRSFSERSFIQESGRRNRRKMLWTNEASVSAAEEFKALYETKKSSSFLKREYQDIATKLNHKFGPGVFSETSVRNRKGFFQCLSHIYISLKDHKVYNRFDERNVPILSDDEWKDISQYFEPSYLRKFRGKNDNTDLEIVCRIFKKRPMKRHGEDERPFSDDELRVVKRFVSLVQCGTLSLQEVTTVFAQSESSLGIELLSPHVDSPDREFMEFVRANFDLNKEAVNVGDVDIQRFWTMMHMTQDREM